VRVGKNAASSVAAEIARIVGFGESSKCFEHRNVLSCRSGEVCGIGAESYGPIWGQISMASFEAVPFMPTVQSIPAVRLHVDLCAGGSLEPVKIVLLEYIAASGSLSRTARHNLF
jgi:hypothetical protein